MPQSTDHEEVRRALERAMKGTIGVRTPKPDVLDAAIAAAEKAAAALESADDRGAAMSSIGEGLPGDLRAWLFELPSFLAKKGRADTGHQLCDRFLPLLGEEYVESERCLVHWEAGDRPKARELSSALLDRFPEHPWVHLRAGTVAERFLEHRRAQSEYEKSLELARREGSDRSDLRFAFDALISFHQQQGEGQRAVDLSHQMLKELPEVEEEFRIETIVNSGPKTGRNDPCPCGSGKKYKKCCALAGA